VYVALCTVPARSQHVENLLEMSDKARLSDHDIVQLINGLVDKIQSADLKHSVVSTQVGRHMLTVVCYSTLKV